MVQLRAQARKMPTNVSTEKLRTLQAVGPPQGMSLAPPPGMEKHRPLSRRCPPPPEVRIMARLKTLGGGGVGGEPARQRGEVSRGGGGSPHTPRCRAVL